MVSAILLDGRKIRTVQPAIRADLSLIYLRNPIHTIMPIRNVISIENAHREDAIVYDCNKQISHTPTDIEMKICNPIEMIINRIVEEQGRV